MQTKEQFLKPEDAARLKEVWRRAAEKIPAQATPEKAPAFHVNFRVNLLEALRATWETAKVTVEAIAAVHGIFDPVTLLGIGVEAVSAVRSVISSLVQTMQPIDYITYVFLSETPAGIDKSALKTSVEAFFAKPDSKGFAWYLGMNESLVERAKEVLSSPHWMDDVLDRLTKTNMVNVRDTQVIFQPRNFTIGWGSE